MKYKKITDLESFDKNPFIEAALEDIKTIRKVSYFNPKNKDEMQMIVSQGGDLQGETAFIKHVEVDEKKFAKIYLSQFSSFYDLPKSAIRVFGYIINTIKPNKSEFYFEMDEAINYTGYSGKNSVLNGLAHLVDNNIIARSKVHYKYYINPMVVFNGNRVTFAKTYLKKRKTDPNQLEIFNKNK